MHEFEYNVALRIKHGGLSAETISNELGLQPIFSWTAGHPRRTPNGSLLDGIYKDTYCCFDLDKRIGNDLAEFLHQCNARLSPHKNFFSHISKTGGFIEYYISWYSDCNSGQTFCVQLLSELTELFIDLSIDFYGASYVHSDIDT